MENKQTSPWLTIAEAAQYAKVSLRTIHRWLDDGLESSKKGGIVRIHRDVLDQYFQNHTSSRGVDTIEKGHDA